MKFNEQEYKLLQEVKKFSETKVKKRAEEIDQRAEFPTDLVNEMINMGLFAMYIPKEYGGLGYSLSSLMETVRIISRYCASTSLILDVTVSLFAEPIIQFGSPELKSKYLPNIAKGHIGALAITEPNAGSDAVAIKTVAKKRGSSYVIDGSKTFITNGKEAKYYLVSAMTNPSLRHKGMSLFVVERNFPGVKIGAEFHKLGIRGSSTTEVIFENVEVPEENLLYKEGDGFRIEMETLNVGRIGIASQAIGISEGALSDIIDFVKTNPKIREYNQFKIADMVNKVMSAVRNYEAAVEYSESGKNSPTLSSVSKLSAGDNAVDVTTMALSILSLKAFELSYPTERRFREAKITQIYEGTNEIQRLVISRELIKNKENFLET